MPELPEVETIRQQLNQHLLGKTLMSVRLLDPKVGRYLGSGLLEEIVGRKVKEVGRRAKVLMVFFDHGQVLAFHLKMTGQIILKNPAITHLPNKHTRAIFEFSDRTTLFFQDMRKFGWLKVLPEKNVYENLFMERLGPEPFSSDFTQAFFWSELKKSHMPIKIFLLDQSKIAGIGNIYANEALFLAKIHPETRSMDLDRQQAENLYRRIIEVLKKGISLGGASDNSYLNAFGGKGEYQNHFLVYRRQGQKCLVCQAEIKRIKVGGRGTFFCSRCQT